MLEISTDTATICLFDLSCLAHRKDDVGDWWSLPKDELQEINDGNAIFFNVGSDGTYLLNLSAEKPEVGQDYNVTVPSGRVFIGPGEEVSGGGFEPDGKWGGIFFDLTPGNYVCTVGREQNVIHLFLSPGGNGRNALTDLIRL